MNTIPTPRTDAAGYYVDPDLEDGPVVDVCFARQLEQELSVEREKHAADVSTLRDGFEAFADHFRCFEHTSSDPSDLVAFKKARAIIAEHSE
jgi:hypothetical protein